MKYFYHLFLILILSYAGIGLFSCDNAAGKDAEKTEAPTSESEIYNEQHRPQFHFSPAANWMNDPNGMVYYEGEYHLFYQYYPDSNVWGPMHWAHAVTEDFVHWEHLPIGLYPDSLGYIFSGSAVVDWKNTSGFGKDGQPPLIAIFTHHEPKGAEDENNIRFQYQSIAYSNDKGRSWTKYEGNPVIPNPGIKDFRDPKVVWDDDSNQWVMVFAAYDHSKFYGSKDLKSWTHLSDWGKEMGAHGGVWECPDFFQMPVEGTDETKWVLIQSLNPGGPNGGSGTQYFVGDFDGTTFTLDPSMASEVADGKGLWLDYGRDNYAGVTWSDIPAADGRRLFIGWMSNWDYAQVVPTYVWRSANTLPRKMVLQKTDNSYRISSTPVKEIAANRGKSFSISKTDVSEKTNLTDKLGFAPSQSEFILEFENADAKSFGVELSNSKGESYRIGYDAEKGQYFSDRTKAGDHSFSPKFAAEIHPAPRNSNDKTVKMHLFFDASSSELFADDGATVMTDILFPTENFNQISLFSESGKVSVSGEAFEMKRIW